MMLSKKIEINEKSIHTVYRRDCLLLAIFTIFMWTILIPVLMQVLTLTDNGSVKMIMTLIAVLTGIALTLGMAAVFLHIRKNSEKIYHEDLENLAILKEQE